jgi:hypothetical protein
VVVEIRCPVSVNPLNGKENTMNRLNSRAGKGKWYERNLDKLCEILIVVAVAPAIVYSLASLGGVAVV